MQELNETIWVTLAPSEIHGVGVFAIRDIPKGTEIARKRPYPFAITAEMFLTILPEIQRIILDRKLFEDVKILIFNSPNDDADLRSFMNHADVPNSDGVRTLRDIKKSTEITENYFSMLPAPHSLSRKHYPFIWK